MEKSADRTRRKEKAGIQQMQYCRYLGWRPENSVIQLVYAHPVLLFRLKLVS
jgi:hypothetical protein